jgi:hypothetical protein
MKRLTSITVLCCAATVAVAAEERQGSPSTASAPSTVTGCLRAGEAQNTFVLTVAGDPGAGTAGTAGTASGDRTTGSSPHATGTPGNTPIKTVTYQLTPGSGSVDFRRFVGQRVKVTGTVDAASKPAIASSSTSSTTESADAKPQDQATPVVTTTEATRVQAQRLQVASISPVGGSCQAP